MAINTKNPSALRIRYDHGKDEITGNRIIRSKTYSDVKPAATDQAILEVANAIISCQQYNVQEIVRCDNETLSE